jgi:NIMA (never in mitosis gene a)-related kinase 2
MQVDSILTYCEILCRKEINYLKMSQKERDQLHAEFSILASLKHPNIVGYFNREHLRNTQELYLYMEYCGGGDLGTIIKDLKKSNTYAKEEFVWKIFSQIVTALYRCHYGIDPPEAGNDFTRQTDRSINKGKMILHRDLKPENIFLGEDQSVKLGDFGLSKIMQSHDFASTYVGTPFYMSPEICAAEKYTLHSDIWSLGCIMYELCTKEPPFNANSHLQLVQRIRKGDFKPIPSHYSKDLANVISHCLKTNPTQRPDTASLLTVPYIWISRKQSEILALGNDMKARETLAEQKMRQAEERLSALEADRAALEVEIDARLRREWELKARLEIDNQIQQELARLRRTFDHEVEERAARLAKQKSTSATRALKDIRNPPGRPSDKESFNSSSYNTAGEEDFPSTTDITDLSDLSINSPASSSTNPPPKKTKTPFARSKTTFDSPIDVQMSEPSPMSISSLALSPRRNAVAQATASANPTMTSAGVKNIFAEAARQKARWEPQLASYSDEENIDPVDDDSDDDFPDLPSPTRPKASAINTDPFKQPRPVLTRQNTTATMEKLITKPTLFPASNNNTGAQIRANIAAARNAPSSLPRTITDPDLKSTSCRPLSPNRRLSKIPSRNDLRDFAIVADATATHTNTSTSPLRRAATVGGGPLRSKLAGGSHLPPNTTTNGIGGRTLVELAQARAGGQLPSKMKSEFMGKELPPVPVWDHEIYGDEMPSPFLKKDCKVIRGMR